MDKVFNFFAKKHPVSTLGAVVTIGAVTSTVAGFIAFPVFSVAAVAIATGATFTLENRVSRILKKADALDKEIDELEQKLKNTPITPK